MKDFGNDIIVLSDDDGERYELEHLYNFEYAGEDYAVFLPAGELSGKDNDLILLRVVYDDGEEEYESIPEELYDAVNEAFSESLFDNDLNE